MNKITIEQTEAIVGKSLAEQSATVTTQRITHEEWLGAVKTLPKNHDMRPSEIANVVLELRKNPNEQPIISAEEARKLGPGKVEWSSERPSEATKEHWYKCEDGCLYDKYSVVTGFPVKYRAIKQPEPVEPHAELKAMYEQQVKDGTVGNYVWEYRHQETQMWYSIDAELGTFFPETFYRCTPKPTCQVRNYDTGELKTMTREAAKLLQAELGDTVQWFDADGCSAPPACIMELIAEKSYTYKLNTQVKLDGKFITESDAIAEAKAKILTHSLFYKYNKQVDFEITSICFNPHSNQNFEYQLRLKPTVKLTIDDEPAKMLTPAQCEAERLARIDTHDVHFDYGGECRLIRKRPFDWTQPLLKGCATNFGEWLRKDDGDHPDYAETILHNEHVYNHLSKCHLIEPTNANWQVYIQGETDLTTLKGVEIELLITTVNARAPNTEHVQNYPCGLTSNQALKAYRITGLADGYCYGGEV